MKRLINIWDSEKKQGDEIGICLEGDCIQDIRLLTADQALRHRSKHRAKELDGDPFFQLHIQLLVKDKRDTSRAFPKGKIIFDKIISSQKSWEVKGFHTSCLK